MRKRWELKSTGFFSFPWCCFLLFLSPPLPPLFPNRVLEKCVAPLIVSLHCISTISPSHLDISRTDTVNAAFLFIYSAIGRPYENFENSLSRISHFGTIVEIDRLQRLNPLEIMIPLLLVSPSNLVRHYFTEILTRYK